MAAGTGGAFVAGGAAVAMLNALRSTPLRLKTDGARLGSGLRYVSSRKLVNIFSASSTVIQFMDSITLEQFAITEGQARHKARSWNLTVNGLVSHVYGRYAT